MCRTEHLILMLSWLSPPLHRMSGSWEKTQCDLALEKGFLFTHSKRILLFPGLVRDRVTCSVAHDTKHVYHVEIFTMDKTEQWIEN